MITFTVPTWLAWLIAIVIGLPAILVGIAVIVLIVLVIISALKGDKNTARIEHL